MKLAFAVVLATLSVQAWAWSDAGHRLVCEIAFRQLDGDARQGITRLLAAMPREHRARVSFAGNVLFRDTCAWPDKVRDLDEYAPLRTWHYMDMQRTDESVHNGGCVRGCLVDAISTHAGILANESATDWQRLQALMFLGHWIADLHQPFHVAYSDDLGGARVRVSGVGDCGNLHAVWDVCLIEHAGGTVDELARALVSDIDDVSRTRWQAGTLMSWAQESYDVVRRPETGYCRYSAGAACESFGDAVRVLPGDYARTHWPVARGRLQRAGVRLGAMLNALLGSR